MLTRSCLALCLLFLIAPSPTPACSLCGSIITRNTFGQDFDRWAVVLYGKVVDSRLSADRDARPGSGSSSFVVERVLKGDPSLAAKKQLELPGYIPVLDEKAPPSFVMFFGLDKKELVPAGGREIRSAELLEYLEKAQAARAEKDPLAALLFYARYLDHAEDAIAEDAFLEFAKSSDAEVGEAARKLDPAFFRKLIEDPKTPSERLSLFAFLLAGSQDASQADFLKGLIDRPNERTLEALDGILCGYIALRPKEGWDYVARLLADDKQSFKVRSNVLGTVRFFHNWKPKESRGEVLRALGGMIETELADMAIEDLRRWSLFDHSVLIFKQYARPGFDAPIIRRSIIRYALVARTNAEARPSAERFLKSLPAKDQSIVREVAQGLSLER